MSHTRMLMLLRTLAPVLIALLAMIACNKSPVGPDSSRNLALRIDGPASIAPGTTAQYRLVEPHSDGTSEDVTASAVWTAADQRILSVVENRVTAVGRGETDLVAGTNGRTVQQRILVLEPETYRLTGTVMVAGLAMVGVEVRVVSGIGEGLTATTGSRGDYQLYGLAGEVRIDATHPSLQRETRPLTVSGHTIADFTLRPLEGVATISGAWRLTLTVSPQCESTFPAELTRRTYDVTLLEQGTRLNILVGAPLETLNIGASLHDRTISFEVFAYSYYGSLIYRLVEWIASDRYLGITGKAQARINDGATAIAGSFSGEFVLYKGRDYWNTSLLASCTGDDHTIRFERK